MHRRKKCLKADGQPKGAYEEAAAAWRVVRRIEAQRMALEGVLRPYECPSCKLFHIGRPGGQGRTNRAKTPHPTSKRRTGWT